MSTTSASYDQFLQAKPFSTKPNEILGIRPIPALVPSPREVQAIMNDIKIAYRLMMICFHPDKNNNRETDEIFEEFTKIVNQAKAIMTKIVDDIMTLKMGEKINSATLADDMITKFSKKEEDPNYVAVLAGISESLKKKNGDDKPRPRAFEHGNDTEVDLIERQPHLPYSNGPLNSMGHYLGMRNTTAVQWNFISDATGKRVYQTNPETFFQVNSDTMDAYDHAHMFAYVNEKRDAVLKSFAEVTFSDDCIEKMEIIEMMRRDGLELQSMSEAMQNYANQHYKLGYLSALRNDVFAKTTMWMEQQNGIPVIRYESSISISDDDAIKLFKAREAYTKSKSDFYETWSKIDYEPDESDKNVVMGLRSLFYKDRAHLNLLENAVYMKSCNSKVGGVEEKEDVHATIKLETQEREDRARKVYESWLQGRTLVKFPKTYLGLDVGTRVVYQMRTELCWGTIEKVNPQGYDIGGRCYDPKLVSRVVYDATLHGDDRVFKMMKTILSNADNMGLNEIQADVFDEIGCVVYRSDLVYIACQFDSDEIDKDFCMYVDREYVGLPVGTSALVLCGEHMGCACMIVECNTQERTYDIKLRVGKVDVVALVHWGVVIA